MQVCKLFSFHVRCTRSESVWEMPVLARRNDRHAEGNLMTMRSVVMGMIFEIEGCSCNDVDISGIHFWSIRQDDQGFEIGYERV